MTPPHECHSLSPGWPTRREIPGTTGLQSRHSVSTSWHVGSLHPEKPQRLCNACWQHLITTCICNLGILPRLTFTWSNLGKGSRVQFCRAFCSDFDCPCGLHMHLPKIAHGAWRKHNRCTRNGIISKFHLTSAKTAKTLAALLPQLNFHIVGSRSVRCGVI
jgi:hypothetical protein